MPEGARPEEGEQVRYLTELLDVFDREGVSQLDALAIPGGPMGVLHDHEHRHPASDTRQSNLRA
ncbi:hypothetical protein ACWGH8_27975 [Nonomuraea muscovyensis]